MRVMILPIAVFVPFGIFAAMRMITGDPLSAVVLALLVLISVGAWFAGPGFTSGPAPRRG